MAATNVERSRISARVTAYAQQKIELAANMAATTVSQFVAQAALREAERIIEEENVVRLLSADFERFTSILDNPPSISPKLAASFNRYKEALNAPKTSSSSFEWQSQP